MKVLGIESSCDETAAAVVELKDISSGARLLSNTVASSMDLHVKYGGVVPEIAARSHIEAINPAIEQALSYSKCDWDNIDAIAVTYGAGLGGSLLVGVLAARTLAITKNKPLQACNHVLGHVYANFITESFLPSYKTPDRPPEFPMLALIVSGGHSQLALFRDFFDYELLGITLDDAAGEAFDKVAKIIGLPYPGGPSVSKAAENGDPDKYRLPKAKISGYDFSFSGIKTAVLRLAQAEVGKDFTFPSHAIPPLLSKQQQADIAASFQKTAIRTLVDKARKAFEQFRPKSVVIAGGVAANSELRRQLAEAIPLPVDYPDIKLCTDNGAMIATLGCYQALLDQPAADPYSLAIQPNLSM